MAQEFSTGRLVVLALSAILAMPWATTASFVRGGDELPKCGVTAAGNDPCGNIGGQVCDENKPSCIGCGTGQKKYVCKNGDAACAGVGCTANQHKQDLDSDCVHEDCP